MTKSVSVTIPREIYERSQTLAERRAQTITDVLSDGLDMIEEKSIHSFSDEELMDREEATYLRQQDELLAKYQGQFVAIYKGNLFDHDSEETALLRRLDNGYPDKVVLLRKVVPGPEQPLRAPAPHFVND